MQFQYYRFFLSPINGNLFTHIQNSREKAIKSSFTNNSDINYRGYDYSIRFINKYDNIVHFKIAKHTTVSINKPPEENFETDIIDHWPNINMIVGINDRINNDYGQIIAVEQKTSVIENPINILREWADKKNIDLVQYGYSLSINPISQKRSFWNVVKQYENRIEELVLEYAMPNLFNTKDNLEQDLKNANQNFNTTKAKIVFTNKNGSLNLPEDNLLLQQSAEYIDNGGGEFKIKPKGERKYIVSAKTIKTKNVDIKNLNIQSSTPQAAQNLLKSILELNE